jgi:hypothetical protein
MNDFGCEASLSNYSISLISILDSVSLLCKSPEFSMLVEPLKCESCGVDLSSQYGTVQCRECGAINLLPGFAMKAEIEDQNET